MIVNFVDLINEEKEKMEEAKELRCKLVEQERLRKLDEANAWMSIDFKSIGATNDKMRAAAVSRHMNQFPNIVAQNKVKLVNLDNDIKFIRDTLSIMERFGVENIEIKSQEEENEEDKNEGSGDSSS